MPKISIVIPHLGRDEILFWQLRELYNQSFMDFEVIIVVDEVDNRADRLMSDWTIYLGDNHIAHMTGGRKDYFKHILFSGGRGPAASRNIGAQKASSDIVLFVGSDCIPDKHLLAEHYYSHLLGVDIVQGYTPFHRSVITPFYEFLDTSGLQAAWTNLRDNGQWKQRIDPAFCLTTNYSIKKQLFINEQFDERFASAAWEDVQLGYRLSKYGDALTAIINPNAINYHYHRYDLDSFLHRCRMEGYHRLTICKIHPEMAWGMTNPYELRTAKDIDEYEIVKWAKEFDSITPKGSEEDQKALKEQQYQRYFEACKIFSLKGVLARIEDEHPAMQALKHVHQNEQVIEIISGVAALEQGHLGYANHSAQWFVSERDDDWSAFSYLGEAELDSDNKVEAIEAFRKSLMINPDADWPKNRLSELT